MRERSLTSPEPFFVFSYTAFASSIHCVKLLPSSSEAESKPLSSELSTNSLVVAAVSGACWKFLTRVISNRKGTLIHEAGECFAPHIPFRCGKGSATCRTKVEMFILIWFMKLNSVQFSAQLNIDMTQNKLFEILEEQTRKSKKSNLTRKLASTMHLDESAMQ